MTSISFPDISTGIYRFPKQQAAQIALTRIVALLEENETIARVNVVCFEEQNADIYRALLETV